MMEPLVTRKLAERAYPQKKRRNSQRVKVPMSIAKK